MKAYRGIFFFALILLFLFGCGDNANKKESGDNQKNTVTQKVKLDIHIMSKCTWSAKVLTTLFPIFEKMGENIDFKLHYIAKEDNGEWKSSHGASEAQGNIIQLCVNQHADDASHWISFIKCQLKDRRKIPSGWEECAKQNKIDADVIKNCAEGNEGKKLLVASYKYSQEKNAKGSPTIFLSSRPYTGGRTEASFGRAICDEFTETKPKYCANIPEPVKVPVTIVTDKRCEGRACNPRRFLSFVRSTFEGAEIKTYDYLEPEGKAIFDRSGQQYLPIAVFGANVEKVENGFNRLQRYFTPKKNNEYVYPLGTKGNSPWDPAAEICNDGKDNTGNGQVDCDDKTCHGKKECRQEQKAKVDLFVMSHCPFGIRTVNAIMPVLKHFNNDKSQFDFTLQFIGSQREGHLVSLHGPKEVEENKRQICAQKYYPKNYQFMDYVLCRNDAFQKNNGREEENGWEECAKNGIIASVIQKCADGDEGEQLLQASNELAANLNLTGSPSWLLNNRLDMRARAPRQIKKVFCEKNPTISACNKELKQKISATLPPVPSDACNATPPAIPGEKKASPAISPIKTKNKALATTKANDTAKEPLHKGSGNVPATRRSQK